MLHCWMNISPAEASTEPGARNTGVQELLNAENDSAMIRQIDMRLRAIGAATTQPITDTRSINREFVLIERDELKDPPELRLTTGLVVRLFPCTADGVNIDRDPIEPRGE